ncbi:hypothetical protein B0H13DRAFT_1878562 [Mycena leptocephala]|nr:hypothetical protein B0H13DRAFT_1878562 [Mycena leptocephala]
MPMDAWDGDTDKMSVQDFLRAFHRDVKVTTSSADKAKAFKHYLAADSDVDVWFRALPAATRADMDLIEAAIEAQYPSEATVQPTAAEYGTMLLKCRLTMEELGTKTKAADRDVWAHHVWGNKMLRLATKAGVAATTTYIEQVRVELPKPLRTKIAKTHADWATFIKAIRDVDTVELELDMKEWKEEKEQRDNITKMLEQRPALQASPTAGIRAQLTNARISAPAQGPARCVPTTPRNAYLNSARGIAAWILVLSVIIGASYSQQPSKCFTQNLNSAKDIPDWILVLSIIFASDMATQNKNPSSIGEEFIWYPGGCRELENRLKQYKDRIVIANRFQSRTDSLTSIHALSLLQLGLSKNLESLDEEVQFKCTTIKSMRRSPCRQIQWLKNHNCWSPSLQLKGCHAADYFQYKGIKLISSASSPGWLGSAAPPLPPNDSSDSATRTCPTIPSIFKGIDLLARTTVPTETPRHSPHAGKEEDCFEAAGAGRSKHHNPVEPLRYTTTDHAPTPLPADLSTEESALEPPPSPPVTTWKWETPE